MKTEQKNRASAKIKNNGRQYCVQYQKHVCTTFVAVVLFCTLLIQAQAAAWYFKKNDDHTPPVCDKSQEEIALYDGYYVNDAAADEKVIYLTFDAGYENGNVSRIVDILEQHHAPGAFFVLKHFITANPDLIRKMDAAGCLICNHTCSHKDMSCANRETFEAELRGLEEICFQTTGVQISPFYRPPEGKYSTENLKWAQEMGYRTIFWSFAYADWDNHDQPKPERALKNLLSHVHNGEILLLHPTSETNAEILDSFLSELEAQGYRFGSLQELGQKTKADKRTPAQTTETGC